MQSKSDRQKGHNWKFYLIASVPIIAIFFIIPFELYYNSKEYWNWNYSIPLVFAGFGILLYLSVLAIIGVIFRIRYRISRHICISLFCLGLFILFADIFSPLQTNLLDGSKLVSTEPLMDTVIESAFFLILIIAVLKMRNRRIVLVGVPFTIFMIILSGVYLSVISLSEKPGPASGEIRHNPNLRGNVYHIVLDAMQTDAAMLVLSESNNEKYFTGFTLFQNNISNYLYTLASFPSYLTGSIYRGGGFADWKRMFMKRGLLASLYEKGYRITMYSPRHHWNNPFVSDFVTLDDVYEQETNIVDSQYPEFVQIWFARIMPNILTNEALSIGAEIGKYVYGLISKPKDPQKKFPVTIQEGKEPFSSVLMFKELIEAEKDRIPNGRYMYVHALLPHAPYIFDENCNYNPQLGAAKARGYYGNVTCAFNLVIDFLEELRRLGRYNDSTIVIHADTGHGHRGFIKKDGSRIVGTMDVQKGKRGGSYMKNKIGWTEEQVKARIMALLMIKPPTASGGLKFSERKSQLIDFYPTLIDLLDLPPPKNGRISGHSLFKKSFPQTRKAMFFLFPPGDEEPKIKKIMIANQEMIAKSDLIDAGFVERFPPMDLPKEGLAFNIGSYEGRLVLDGFCDQESFQDKSFSWRWALGKKSKMTFDSLRLTKSRRILVKFKIKPFVINRNKEMTVKTRLSKAKIRLKPGWYRYSVVLEFPFDEDPSIDIFYEGAKSPKSTGISRDPRNLSVAWSEISLHYAPSLNK